MRRGDPVEDTHHAANFRCPGPKPMAQELVKGTGPVNVMISAKEEDDLIRQQYNSALRPDAGELRTC